MARRTKRPPVTRALSLEPLSRTCSSCGGTLWAGYDASHTITTLHAVKQGRRNCGSGRQRRCGRVRARRGAACARSWRCGMKPVAPHGASAKTPPRILPNLKQSNFQMVCQGRFVTQDGKAYRQSPRQGYCRFPPQHGTLGEW